MRTIHLSCDRCDSNVASTQGRLPEGWLELRDNHLCSRCHREFEIWMHSGPEPEQGHWALYGDDGPIGSSSSYDFLRTVRDSLQRTGFYANLEIRPVAK